MIDIVIMAMSVSLLPSAFAAAPAKAAVCTACHGADGFGTQSKYPNLAGQSKDYLLSQLKAFKDDARKNDEMAPMAKMLNAKEMEQLAAHFSQLKGCK